MTQLQIRRIPFAFDETTPFQWNPANPGFGLFCNSISFFAPGFEKYIVLATRAAMKQIEDSDLLEEAHAFLKQEAQHARIHRQHLDALIARYPGLQSTLDEMIASYDELFASRPLEFHLSYIANLEATFTPLFGLLLDHRAHLFDNGDPRVASLFLWHFVEEIEHRSSAFVIYNAVVRSRTHRLGILPEQIRHLLHLGGVAARGFNDHVPLEHRLIDAEPDPRIRAPRARELASPPPPPAFGEVPRLALVRMAGRLLLSQWPWHHPKDEPLPPFAAEWTRAYDEGRDVTDWYATPTA